jgi:hypothetical protein
MNIETIINNPLGLQIEGGDELGYATPMPCSSTPNPCRDSYRGGAIPYEA